jgi:predicted nucleic acid-binding protein
MTANVRFTLDTNILFYAVDTDAGEKHDIARAIVGWAAHANCVLTVQALAEFYHAATRKRMADSGKAARLVLRWRQLFETTAADAQTVENAVKLEQDHGVSFWDAMLLATARQAACAVILSEDMQDGHRLTGLQIINPFADRAGAALDDLMPRVS